MKTNKQKKWKDLFQSSSNPRLSSGRRVSHQENHATHPLSVNFIENTVSSFWSLSISLVWAGRPHTAFCLKSVSARLLVQMLNVLHVAHQSPVCPGLWGKQISLSGRWACLRLQSTPHLRGWAEKTGSRAWVAKCEIHFMKIIRIISSTSLLYKNKMKRKQSHLRVRLAGVQSCSGDGSAPVALAALLGWVDWCRSACSYPFDKYI